MFHDAITDKIVGIHRHHVVSIKFPHPPHADKQFSHFVALNHRVMILLRNRKIGVDKFQALVEALTEYRPLMTYGNQSEP